MLCRTFKYTVHTVPIVCCTVHNVPLASCTVHTVPTVLYTNVFSTFLPLDLVCFYALSNEFVKPLMQLTICNGFTLNRANL